VKQASWQLLFEGTTFSEEGDDRTWLMKQ